MILIRKSIFVNKLFLSFSMLEILKFIFSDFWYFAGTLVLITVISSGISKIIFAIRNKKYL